jgi:hypothetical protein
MLMPFPFIRCAFRHARLAHLLAAAALLLGVAAPASAQLFRASPSSGLSTILDIRGGSNQTRGTDVGYDPAHNVFLVVGGYGPIYGQFVDASGAPLAPMFSIMSDPAYFGHFPRVTFSPDANSGLGGFLVTWHENSFGPSANEVHGVMVAYPAGVISADRTISSGSQGLTFWEMPAPGAYSVTSRRFLVVWTTLDFGIQGRFVDDTGAPIGSVMPIENPGSARWPAAAWNPLTNEFGISYCRWGNSSGWVVFRRLGASDGVLWPRSSFGFTTGTFATDIAFNNATGNLVMAYSTASDVQSAAFDIGGNLLGSGLVSIFLRYNTDNLGLSFNPATRTFLVTGHSGGSDAIGVELNSNGAPNSSYAVLTGGATLGSFYPRTAANTTVGQWAVSFAMDLKVAADQIVGTTSTNGGSSDPIGAPYGGSSGSGGTGSGGTTPSVCTTPDPFAALGGGTCVNGGWVPGGSNTGSGGCTTPDPFAAIGGGTCVNGGWVPGRSNTGSTGGSGGCTIPDPFALLGGGTCVNGGWLPAPPGSTGASGACSTVQPGAGWTCVNGGWVPPGNTPIATGTCSTPDPFAALGGGICVNGGWVPK